MPVRLRYADAYRPGAKQITAWNDAAMASIEAGAQPEDWVVAQFEEGTVIPYPNNLHGQYAHDRYKKWSNADAVADIELHLASYADTVRTWRREAPLETVLTDPRHGFPPVFVWCIATLGNLPDIAASVADAARAQLNRPAYRLVYRKHWRHPEPTRRRRSMHLVATAPARALLAAHLIRCTPVIEKAVTVLRPEDLCYRDEQVLQLLWAISRDWFLSARRPIPPMYLSLEITKRLQGDPEFAESLDTEELLNTVTSAYTVDETTFNPEYVLTAIQEFVDSRRVGQAISDAAGGMDPLDARLEKLMRVYSSTRISQGQPRHLFGCRQAVRVSAQRPVWHRVYRHLAGRWQLDWRGLRAAGGIRHG